MKCKDTRLPHIMAAVLAAGLGPTAVRAQTTPGAIPDPGTYQGSMQIQEEQDRQAQQYRQQSAPPFQQPQQPQGSYPGRSPATSNTSSPPDCYDKLARQPELAPLAQKVYLGHSDLQSSALFDIQTVPTAAERPLLLKWSAGRRGCLELAKRVNKVTPDYSAQAKRLDELSGQITIDMIAQLAEGKLTYGQFNRQRTKNAIVVEQTP